MDQCTSCKQPCASFSGSTPKYSFIFSFHNLGTASTVTVPSNSPSSISKRRITCSGYVTSSASTRIIDSSRTLFTAAYRSSGVRSSGNASGNAPRILGSKYLANAGLSPTMRSQSKDWLSWIAMPAAAFTGSPSYSKQRPCSYRACPVSWIAPVSPSMMSSALKRVVIRTSVGCAPPVNGWTLTSKRPRSKSKPNATETSLQSAACFSVSYSPWSHEESGGVPFSRKSRNNPTMPILTASNISRIRAAVRPAE
mmetsp:Transcript_62519/g.191233  ORF Transcript_62519/g.191233 Transcript_62519/m.191233 type:complete len:253 (+) Transcript_62519:358-1116(+)